MVWLLLNMEGLGASCALRMFDWRIGGAIVGRMIASCISSSSVRRRFASANCQLGPPCTREGRIGSSSSSGSKTLLIGGLAGLGAG